MYRRLAALFVAGLVLLALDVPASGLGSDVPDDGTALTSTPPLVADDPVPSEDQEDTREDDDATICRYCP